MLGQGAQKRRLSLQKGGQDGFMMCTLGIL